MSRWTGWVLAALCCIVLAPCRAVQAPELPATPQPSQLGVADGLPSNEINAIDEDADGYLWIATSDGLARFDGIGYRVWRREDGLRDNRVWSVRVDARNRVWIGTEKAGLAVLDAERRHFRYYDQSTEPLIASNTIWSIETMPDGDVWFGSDDGLYRLHDGRLRRFAPDPADPQGLPNAGVPQLLRGAGGRLWIGTRAGVAVWDGQRIRRLPAPSGGEVNVDGLTLDADGTLWIGTISGVLAWNGSRYVDPAWSGARQAHVMHLLLQDRSGIRWLDTSDGLGRDAAGAVRNVPLYSNAARGLVKPLWAEAFQDREGGLWFAATNNGLWYLRRDWRQFSVFSRLADDPASIGNARVIGMAPARDGRVWQVGSGGTLDLFDPHTGAVRHVLSDLCDRYLPLSVLQDSAGTLWVGCRRGVLHYDPRTGRSTLLGMEEEHSAWPRAIQRIVEDPLHRLWFMGDRGVRVIDLRQRAIPGLPTDELDQLVPEVSDVAVGPDGRVWLATASGVFAWDDAVHALRPVAGAPHPAPQALAVQDARVVWMASPGRVQAFEWDGRALRPGIAIAREQGMPLVDVRGLAVDPAGLLWAGTMRGLVRIDPARRSTRVYGIGDGLPSQEFSGPPLVADDGRRILAGTPEGLVVFDPAVVRPSDRQPTLALQSLVVRRGDRVRALDRHGGFVLSHDDRDLDVVVRIPSFTDTSAHRYRIRLLGYETAWTGVGPDGHRVFSQLQPGSYRLQLMGKTADNVWSRILTVPFRVAPPWWNTGWALAGELLLGALLVGWWAWAYRKRLRRRHAWQLAVQKRELAEQASEAKTRFLATLGHEVRTPMTGVLGMSELLAGTQLEPRQRGYVDAIRRAGEHLLRLVNDALDLARIEAGKLQLDDAVFDPRGLVDEVAGLMAPIAEKRGLHFRDTIAAGVPRAVRGDRTRVQQILLNLLGNAIKFTERGFIAVELSPLLPQGVCYVVKDSGPGLNDEQKQRVFERFEQAEGARTAARYGGSGLGLAISQELAAAMGGRIRVESEPGQGTDFIVELPLQAVGAAKPRVPAPADAQPTGARRLLLVEDDPTVAEVVAGLLRGQGHEVIHVGNGLAALVEVAQSAFDGALLDLDLPGIDGLSLARQLRAQGFAQPLIAVTARTDAGVEALARDAGFDLFLRKPLTGEMLAQAVESTMRAAAAGR